MVDRLGSHLFGYIKRTPIWVYLVLLGYLTFSTYDITISTDMGWYMNSALNLYLGRGFRDINGLLIVTRGPLFPLMMVGSYWLLGVSPWSAFWVVRVFAILTPLAVYALGKKLFDTWIGLSAALLILTSYSMNNWSYRHLDAVWSFFALLSLLVLYRGLEEGRSLSFVLSGLLFGLAYLVKPALILLLPLPIVAVLIIDEYRTKNHYKGLVLYASTIVLLISPWIWYVYSQTLNIKMAVFGIGGDRAADEAIHLNSLVYLKNYFNGLLAYYSGGSQSLSENFILAPLFIFSWIHTAFRALKKDKPSIFLATAAVLLSPYIAYTGRENLRVGQLLFFLLLSYLVTARFCFRLCRKILLWSKALSRFGESHLSFASVMVVTFILVPVQTFASHKSDKGNKDFLKRSLSYQRLIKDRNVQIIRGPFGQASKECGEWIQKAIPAGSAFMAANQISGSAIFFYSHGKYPIYQLPIINSKSLRNVRLCSDNCTPIFLSSWIERIDPRNKIFALRRNDLFSAILERDVKYIIIDRRRNFLTLYLESDPSFKFVKEFSNGLVKIFKVLTSDKTVPNEDFKILVTDRLVGYLDRLRMAKDKTLDWYKTEYFENHLNLEDAFVDLLSDKQRVKMSDRIRMVEVGRVYEIRKQQ